MLVMKEEYKELEAEFLKFATTRHIWHQRTPPIGGFRASIYNAMPKSGYKPG